MGIASELISKIKVRDLMSDKVIVVHDNDPVSMVITLFERCRISGAPVVTESHEYIGVISKTDLVGSRLMNLLQDRGTLHDIKASELMTAIPIAVIRQEDSLTEAIDKMLNNHLHRLFVENEHGVITGVLSSFDVMKLVKFLEKNNDNKDSSEQDVVMISTADSEEEENSTTRSPDQKIAALIMRKQQEMAAKQSS